MVGDRMGGEEARVEGCGSSIVRWGEQLLAVVVAGVGGALNKLEEDEEDSVRDESTPWWSSSSKSW
jgi:hypothetical protein